MRVRMAYLGASMVPLPKPADREKPLLIGKVWFAALIVGFLLLTAAFFLRNRSFTMCCDANGYLVLGQEIGLKGLTAKLLLSHVRTIGYPALIALVDLFPSPFGRDLNVVLTQVLLYCAAATAVLHNSRSLLVALRLRRALAVGLLLNPWAAMHCAETMTESPSITLFLASIAVALAATSNPSALRRRHSVPFAMGLLAGVALIVRPANVVFLVSASLAMAMPPLFTAAKVGARLRKSAGALVALWVGIYIGISPQVGVNLKLFDKATPFPTMKLGDVQMKEGIGHLKYGTFVGPPAVKPIHYLNPLVKGTEVRRNDTFSWYLRNPGRGALTVVAHVFATLAQEPLYTYSVDLAPWYRLPVAVANGFLVVFGLGWLACFLWQRRREAIVSTPAWFISWIVMCSLAVVAFTSPETRFGALPTSVYFASVSIAAERTLSSRRVRPVLLFGGVAASLVFAALVIGLGRFASI